MQGSSASVETLKDGLRDGTLLAACSVNSKPLSLNPKRSTLKPETCPAGTSSSPCRRSSMLLVVVQFFGCLKSEAIRLP